MASGDRKGEGGGGKPGPDSPDADAGAATAAKLEERPLEISSRGKIVLRSSSHPPGEAPSYSDPPVVLLDSTPPAGRSKRDTPAERPRPRRAARAQQTDSSPPAYAGGRATTVLWAIIVALSAALAFSLLR